MHFYHGSKQIINKIIYKGSGKDNDYGPSFYVTLNINDAKEWACKNQEAGIVNKYLIKDSEFNKLRILDLTNKDKYTVLNWLAILMHNRTVDNRFKNTFKNRLEWLEQFYINVDDYDVVKGFRADDSYFKFPLKFISGLLSFENLEKVFMLGNLGIQYAFMSEKAIKKLKFVKSEQCDDSYVGRYYEIVLKATEDFENITNVPLNDDETYITDLMKYEK